MSSISDDVTIDNDQHSAKKENNSKRRRRPRSGKEDNKKMPIRLVSSLGEGKLLERFQNAVGEKENKKRTREKSEKERRAAKEKKERQLAKFQAELDALLEDHSSVPTRKNSDKEKVYVPKLSGTVKGKFQELEKKKLEKEKNKISGERQRRVTRDLMEKKRIQIELAKKKQKGLIDDDDNKSIVPPQPVKQKPGKLKNNFEEFDKQRKQDEKRKIDSERQMKLTEEMRAVKEYYQNQKFKNGDDEDEVDEESLLSPLRTVKTPGKLNCNFDDVIREREEQQHKQVEEEKKIKLEEEKQRFRAERLAAGSLESQNTNSESSLISNNSSCEKMKTKPNKLSSSFTKFDILEKQRIEKESAKIRERRKQLLEEEKKLFEESKQQQELSSSEEEKDTPIKNTKRPGRLASSFTKFDLLTQQKLEQERKRLQEERAKLLEEEKLHFKNQQELLPSSDDEESGNEFESSDMISESESGEETFEKPKHTKRIKKYYQRPKKLDQNKLKFDEIERERIEKERQEIQKQRQQLLEEEAKLFEEARKQQKQTEDTDEEKDEAKLEKNSILPGKLNESFTKFDVQIEQRVETERERIKRERKRLLEEEHKLMEEERKKLQNDEAEVEQEISKLKNTRKPRRLDKSFTEFDVLERERKKKEEEELFRQKARKLEEEKRLFREAREKMHDFEEKEEENEDSHLEANIHTPTTPSKLSSQLTNFDILEQKRLEEERVQAQKLKVEQLENELKQYQEEKQAYQDSDDDVTSSTRALLESSKKSPCPKKLSSAFTNFDILERRRREEERMRLQKEKARKLAEEREMFEKSKQQTQTSDEDEDVKDSKVKIRDLDVLVQQPVKRMNIRGRIEAVIKAKEEEERKRIEETKFTRMTVEQQEMFLARQKQIDFLKKQLAEAEVGMETDEESYDESGSEEYTEDDASDDDEDGCYHSEENSEDVSKDEESEYDEDESKSTHSGSTNSSEGYSGAPYFVQTLSNLTVEEGDPVRFDANINANPHPKVTWYFKNRLIRNSPDYQYINKGTQYSLYMNESFLDDIGQYSCKAENEKGTATSKAFLFVKESRE